MTTLKNRRDKLCGVRRMTTTVGMYNWYAAASWQMASQKWRIMKSITRNHRLCKGMGALSEWLLCLIFSCLFVLALAAIFLGDGDLGLNEFLYE